MRVQEYLVSKAIVRGVVGNAPTRRSAFSVVMSASGRAARAAGEI